MDAELRIAVIGLIIQYGVTAAMNIYQTWSGQVDDPNEPTLEDLEKLKTMTPPADSFF